MKLSFLLGAFLLVAGVGPSGAADVTALRERTVRAPAIVLPSPPRSAEASLVWASDACWRGCARECGWRFQACLPADTQGSCMAQNDACDRMCQVHCRLYGGPLLPLE
jgi:hypothetical protein